MKNSLLVMFWFSLVSVNAQTVHYSYDHVSRLANANYNQKAVSYSYDKDGNRMARTNIICINPIANFSASQVTGHCPLTVDFTNISTTQTGATCEWTIYTDTTSTPSYFSQQNPQGVVFNYGGTFQVSLKVSDACGINTKTVPGYITVICSSAQAGSVVNRPSLLVYPNPTQDIVSINGTHLPQGSYKLELSDVWGRILKTVYSEATSGRLTSSISLKEYATGTYFIKVSGSLTKSFKISKE